MTVSLHEYEFAKRLANSGAPFRAFLMTAMRRADTTNVAKLRAAFPDVWDEMNARYNAPGGRLDTDPPERAS